MVWDNKRMDKNRLAYCKARAIAKGVVALAKGVERRNLYEMLVDEDGKGNLFRVAKQMRKKNRDVVGGGDVKDVDGTIVVDERKTMEIWKTYYEKLMNKETSKLMNKN